MNHKTSAPDVGELAERLLAEVAKHHELSPFVAVAADLVREAASALASSAAETARLREERDEAIDAAFTTDPDNGVSVGWDEVAAMWRSRAEYAEARLASLSLKEGK